MNKEQAEVEAALLWCQNNHRNPVVRTLNGERQIGYSDGEFNYFLGIGTTWEEAVADAKNDRKTK